MTVRDAEQLREHRVEPSKADAREAQSLPIETLGAGQVSDDATDAQDAHGSYFSRSAIRSATRRALAMIVNVGFTAPIEGKKLASVT